MHAGLRCGLLQPHFDLDDQNHKKTLVAVNDDTISRGVYGVTFAFVADYRQI